MSVKYRKANRSKRKTAAMKGQITRGQLAAELLSAMDGYSNAAAFLGENSPLMASGTFVRSGLTSQTDLLTTTYRVS